MLIRRSLLVAVALLATACGPLIVITPSGDGAAPKQLELDEAEKRCDDSEPCACYAAGAFRRDTGEDDRARELFERACDGACSRGCSDLSEAYFEGALGLVRDPSLGTHYAIRACRQEAARCVAAGQRFERGEGVTHDIGRARAFYVEGCQRKDPASCSARDRLVAAAPGSAPAFTR